MRRPLLTCLSAGLAASAFALSLGGCAGAPLSVSGRESPEREVPQQSIDQDTGIFDTSTLDLEFSDRDKDAAYDEATATKVMLSDEGIQIEGAGAVAEGGVVTLGQSGTYVVSGSLSQGQMVVDAADEDKLQVVMAGASIHNENGPALYINNADKCFITLASGTDNTLSDGAAYILEGEDDNRDAVLFSRDDLTINGEGSLVVSGSYQHGICSKDDLIVTGGQLVVTAKEDAFQGKDCIKVAGGAFTVNAGDDGFHSDGHMYMQAGSVTVEACTEGYEGEQVIIDGGEHIITASDDAVNAALSEDGSPSDQEDAGEAGGDAGPFGKDQMAASSSDCLIQINDGRLVLAGANDGLDSNGNVQINGGVVLVSGPDAGMDGALDYDFGAQINGGTVLMTGSVGSVRGLDASGQPVTVGEAAGSAGEEVILSDAEGVELVRMTAAYGFSTILASSPQIPEGSSFSVQVGHETMELVMGSITASTSGGQGGGPESMGALGMPGDPGSMGEHEAPKDGEAPGLPPEREEQDRADPRSGRRSEAV